MSIISCITVIHTNVDIISKSGLADSNDPDRVVTTYANTENSCQSPIKIRTYRYCIMLHAFLMSIHVCCSFS